MVTVSGYEFNISGMTGTVNGKNGSVTGALGSVGSGRCFLTCAFTCVEATVIDEVSLTMVMPLHSEMLPFTAGYPDDAGYRAYHTDEFDPKYGVFNGVKWTDEDNKNLQPGDTVEAGKTYHLTLYLRTVNNSYRFEY